MHKTSYYIINAITTYRIVAAPFLFLLIYYRELEIFRWLLGFSFFTDAIDGYLARKYKVVSRFGARLDSIGDDLTVLAGLVGLFVFKPDLIQSEIPLLLTLLGVFLLQNTLALVKFRKPTSFHTYLAKLAAVLQGSFMILSFFIPQPLSGLFYLAAGITLLELIEETILVLLLPAWEVNVKGIYWVLKRKKSAT